MHTDFPLLQNYPDLVYLDSAATALKPRVVLEAETAYGILYGTNAVRGLYPLAEKTDAELRAARASMAHFLHAETEEIIFTHGTTDGLNSLARSLEATLSDTSTGEILVSIDAHHSQILPWQELSKRKNWSLKIAPLQPSGQIDKAALISLISEHTKIVALTAVSNVYGVINDVSTLVNDIRSQNPEVFIVLDAAQAAAHIPLDVTTLGVDALIFSGHKVYGPTGVGICYLSKKWQEKLPPSQFGGGMVLDTVSTPPAWKTGPEKFEAGTLPLAQIFGLKKAVEYISEIGFPAIQTHDQELVKYSIERLLATFGKNITLLGTQESEEKIGLLSFVLAGAHPHDIASLLGERNICIRAGEHCASFLHRDLALPATTRISFGLHTAKSDIDTLVAALKEIHPLLVR